MLCHMHSAAFVDMFRIDQLHAQHGKSAHRLLYEIIQVLLLESQLQCNLQQVGTLCLDNDTSPVFVILTIAIQIHGLDLKILF